jgi:hypothetical protein
MGKTSITAAEIRLAKMEADLAEAKASAAKKTYEQLRQQLVSEMVNENLFKFEIKGDDDLDAMSFRLETKQRWSPVVESKDVLYDYLMVRAPELFTITPAALTKYCNELCEQNDGELPESLKNLVKKYDDTHVVVRTVKR